MEKIDNYLYLLYKGDNSSEVLELKEELREHLILSANEFINQGYIEEDAYNKAIEKFDGGSEMLKELHKTLKETRHENIKLQKIIRSIFGSIAIISLVIVLLITFQRDKLYENIDIVESTLNSKLNNIVSSDNLYDVSKYEGELEKLLKSKDFKAVKELRIYINPAKNYSGVTIYNYSSEYDENNSLFRIGGDSKELTSKGDRAYFDIEIEHNPLIRDKDFFRNISFIGIICFCIYVILLLRFKMSKDKIA